jgi:leader peptidase (prepilin peptidase)/N-methyltransferase
MFYIFFAVIGTLFGSFLNTVISRLPVKGKFFSESRSACPDCGHVIRWYDLFPVLSWIILMGKCRDCKARISPRYPLVEITSALLAVASIWHFGFTLAAIQIYAVTMILLAIAVIDFKTSEIPDSLIIALIPCSVAAIWLQPEITLLSHIIGFFSIALPLLLLTLLIPGAFGGGDIKLLAVCGFMLGWQMTLLAFFIALLLGGSYAIYLMLSGKRKRGEHMVFGPAICIGIAISIYFGRIILEFYLQFFMF